MRQVILALIISCLAASASAEPARRLSPAVVNPAVRDSRQAMLSLDGQWTFRTDPAKSGEQAGWFKPSAIWRETRAMPVPGCWEAQGIGPPGAHNLLAPINAGRAYVEVGMKGEYEGVAWYRKTAAIPQAWAGKQVWLKFGGVNAVGKAYVNGALVAELGGPGQYCGAYKVNVTDLVQPGRSATIVVMVRNDEPSSKGSRNVARRYGGIDRSVELEATPSLLIDYADVLADAGRQTATVNVTVRQAAPKTRPEGSFALRVVVRDADGMVVGRAGDLPVQCSGETVSRRLDVKLSPCKLWSPEHPALHTAEITLLQDGKTLHGWTERFGVANWTTRGSDILLNGKKFFVRGIGFDAHWPIEVCYPTDRATLRQFMDRVKSLGYNHMRTWAHTPVPEFCEAAAEAGICLTVELPYYHGAPNARQGHHWDPLPKSYDIPQQDLEEVLTQYRRYPSIFTFSGGNEGTLHADTARLLKTVHARAPGKLWTLNSGHIFNVPGVSDYNTDYFVRPGRKGYLSHIANFPHVLHEYYNPAYAFDPRNAPKYRGGYLPPIPLELYQKHVAEAGLSWDWAAATIDAGQAMTFYYQKVAAENARLVDRPRVNGYHMWGSLNGDTLFFALQDSGVLDPFLGPKKGGTPEHFHQFNKPAMLLAKITPHGRSHRNSIFNDGSVRPRTEVFAEQIVFASGETADMDFWLSNFGETDLQGKMEWTIADGDKVLAHGAADCAVPQGGLASVCKTSWTVPELDKAVRLTIAAKLPGADAANRWQVWAFPGAAKYGRPLSGVGATERAYARLKDRYRGLRRCETGKPLADDVKLLVTDDMAAAEAACEQGRRALLVGLYGFTTYQPPVCGGEWVPNLQEGTALAHTHPVFRGFPCKEFLEPVFLRLVRQAALMSPAFKDVTPLVVGAGRVPGPIGKTLPDYLLYAFEAAAGKGRLLATGLDLLADTPEAACLFDGFLAYAESDAFHPQGGFYFKSARKLKDNGRGKLLACAATESCVLFLGKKKTSLVRSRHPEKPLVWETAAVEGGGPAWDAVCFVGMGAADAKPAAFTLCLDGKPVATFSTTINTSQWRGANGIRLNYQVMASATCMAHSTVFADMERAMGTGKKSTEWQSSGILRISIPLALLKRGRAAKLEVRPAAAEGQGWFGLIDPGE